MEFRERLVAVKDLINNSQTLPEDFDAAVSSEKDISYAQGVADGKASMGEDNDDKIYSQVELDEAIANASAPLQTELDSVNLELLSVKSELETMQSEEEGKINEAVASAKSELLAEIEADLQTAQDSENATEQEFKAKLEARKV